MKGRIFASVFH